MNFKSGTKTTAALITLIMLLLPPAVAAEPVQYKFGIVPQFEARHLAAVWVPILEYLETETGHDFVMSGAPGIPEFEQGFLAGEFDFAYMNPYHSLLAAREQAYRPIIRDGERRLFGILVAKAQGNVSDLSDLEDQLIAFPAPNALGASLLMRADFAAAGLINYNTLYAQTHTSAYLNVLLGKAAAAGGVMGTFNRQPEGFRKQLKIIYRTRSMPPHPVVSHPRVSEEVSLSVLNAFLKLPTTPTGQALLQGVPMAKPVAADLTEYEVLGEWGLQRYFVTPGGSK